MVDLIDETFVVATPAALAAALHDPAVTRRYWPDLELTVFQDRGESGIRWTVTGALVGTAEMWAEAWGDGVLLHAYLRADITRRGSATEPIDGSGRRIAHRSLRQRRRRAWTMKRAGWALKADLEAGRPPGEGPAAPA
ncbi:MAG TPA: polyketide cyclase / dehydrase and lipid transport [Mycobacteriales bacterium]|nr:polyketide cyclase / dehydrase and lipid transport [Mycobacteriales bacterium]